MKSTFRSELGAVLLAPLAAFVVATPAAAEHAAVYVQPAVIAQPVPQYYGGHHRGYRRDRRAPEITDVRPDHGDRVRDRGWTRISARFSDDGSGIDPASVTLRVDGRDVTDRARFDEERIRYRDDLAPGRHFAEVVVRDRAGNMSRRAWSFVVVEPGRGYGYGPYGYAPYGYHPQRR